MTTVTLSAQALITIGMVGGATIMLLILLAIAGIASRKDKS